MTRFFSPTEIADLLGVSPKCVRGWISAKTLPAHRFGRLLRVRQVDLEAFLDEHQTHSKPIGSTTKNQALSGHRDSVHSK